MRTPSLSPAALAALAALAASAASACKKDDPPATPASGSSAGSSTGPGSAAAPAPAADGSVEVFIDGASAAKVTAAQLASWPRLDTFLPEDARRLGTWETLSIVGASSSDVQRPSQNYPDMVPVLFPGEGGAAAFGMFDPVELAKQGTPALRAEGVRELRLKLASAGGRSGDHQGGGEAVDPTTLVVRIKAPSGESRLTGTQILAIPREPMPGNDETKGWPLTKLLDAAGVKQFEKLVLLDDSNGTSLIVERKELTGAVVPFIKLNKQGALRLRILKQEGAGWKPSGELRSLSAIEVAK